VVAAAANWDEATYFAVVAQGVYNSWNFKTLLEILEISLNLMVLLEIFV